MVVVALAAVDFGFAPAIVVAPPAATFWASEHDLVGREEASPLPASKKLAGSDSISLPSLRGCGMTGSRISSVYVTDVSWATRDVDSALTYVQKCFRKPRCVSPLRICVRMYIYS